LEEAGIITKKVQYFRFMRAGVILPHTRLYGGVKRFIELGKIFSAKGHTFTLYTPDGIPPNWTTANLRVATFEALAEEELDVLFITDRKNKEILLNSKARYKIFYHVSLTHKSRKMVRDKRLHIFACSSNVARYDKWVFGVKPFLAAGGIDTARFFPQKIVQAREDGIFTILMYGRLSEKIKGTRLIVKACERLYPKYPNLRLLLFDTPVNASMAKAIEDFKTNVPFDFILNHPVEQNLSIFHRADLFVAAEKGAGWANTVAEAMASGIPVVSTKAGTADIVIPGKTGVLVRRNVAAIAKGIEKMIESPELRHELAINARRHIEQFDWQILGDRIISWYESREKEKNQAYGN
jgi:glycosyltransferase involved in cell wall biosynthesis